MTFKNDASDVDEHDEPWIQWFCGLKGHEMFCEVERSYIEDGFNLYGLRVCVSNFSDCLDLILDRIGPDEDSDDSHLTQSACTLYGLIHARYIITAHGLDAMYNKYAAKEFGTCPLIQCAGQPVLPVSLKDEMGVDTVKIYCPKCSQVFHPPPLRSSRATAGGGTSGNGGTGTISGGVDGAAFGTTFPHLFLMTFSNLVPDPLPPESAYVPRIFGFRVHKSSRQRYASTNAATLPGPTTATTSSSQMVAPTGNSNIDSRRDTSLNYDLDDDDDVSNINDDRKELAAALEVDDPKSSRSMQGEHGLGAAKSVSSAKRLNDLMDAQTAVASTLAESPRQDVFDGSDEDRPSSGGGVNTLKRARVVPESFSGATVSSFFSENATKRRRRNNTNNASSNNA